jgi:hypothetical protein
MKTWLLLALLTLAGSAYAQTKIPAPPAPTADVISDSIAAAPAIEIVFPKGVTNISRPIDLPNSKQITIRGEPGAVVNLTSAIPRDCAFRTKKSSDPKRIWDGKLIVRDLTIRARGAADQSCFGTDQGEKVNYDEIRLENLRMSSSGYNVRFDNQEYTIAPTFRNLRGNNGIYWSGAAHAASNLLIENCRFQNGTRGPQIYVYGARNWTIRNNICEGSVPFDRDVDPNAKDVLNTKGILLVNPGPANGTIDSQWLEYWAMEPTDYAITFAYTLNNGGSNKCGTYTIKNTDARRLQVINTSTTDEMTIGIEGGGWTLPNFGDHKEFRTTGKVVTYVEGGQLPNRYRFDNPAVRILEATIIKPGFEPAHYRDGVATIYAYRGGTGIYATGATKGEWSNCRPYVQHHPKFGHSLVFRANEKLTGTAFVASLPKSLATGQLAQEFWTCCPHLAAPVNGNGFGAGMIGSLGNRFTYEPGHTPKRFIGGCEGRDPASFFRLASADKTSGKWLQVFTSAAWRGGFGDSPAIAENYDCYEWPNEPGPPLGTSIKGDVCRSESTVWTCTEAGTSRPIAITANTSKGVSTLASVNDATELLVGDYLDIDGATGVYRVIDIQGESITLDRKVTSTLVNAAIKNHNPTWITN